MSQIDVAISFLKSVPWTGVLIFIAVIAGALGAYFIWFDNLKNKKHAMLKAELKEEAKDDLRRELKESIAATQEHAVGPTTLNMPENEPIDEPEVIEPGKDRMTAKLENIILDKIAKGELDVDVTMVDPEFEAFGKKWKVKIKGKKDGPTEPISDDEDDVDEEWTKV